MEIYIVFEFAEPTHKIIGIYESRYEAMQKYHENVNRRYISKEYVKTIRPNIALI